MKTQIPEELKKDVPQTTWGKLLLATPVVMTVVATLLAGLASSEMTRAQYDRAYAAQLQSKAGDQWGYFQAKKLRGAMQRNSLELLEATVDLQPLDSIELPMSVSESFKATVKKNWTEAAATPDAGAPLIWNSQIFAAIIAIEKQKSEKEISDLLAQISDQTLATALTAHREYASTYDEVWKPVNEAMAQLGKSLPAGNKSAVRYFTAYKMRYNAARYEAEAKLNQNIANLLELQVRKANISAEHHHRRSGKFFYGMLAAQAAVIVSTFAMAARQRNLLWTLAAVAGLAAIVFAIYVYLRV